MTLRVADTAIVDPAARLGDDIEIGAYCVVGPRVMLADGVRLMNHVTLAGRTSVGRRSRVFPGAVLGLGPQPLGGGSGKSSAKRFALLGSLAGDHRVEVGEHVEIRESVTIHGDDQRPTQIGDDSSVLAGARLGGGCRLGEHTWIGAGVIVGALARIGRDVAIEEGAVLRGAVHVADYARVGALSRVVRDIPPYSLVEGNPAQLRGIPGAHLIQQGLAPATVEALREAFQLMFVGGAGPDVVRTTLRARSKLLPAVNYFLTFLESQADLVPRTSAGDQRRAA